MKHIRSSVFVLLVVFQLTACVESELCTSKTIAPLNFGFFTIINDDVEAVTLDTFSATGIFQDVLSDSVLISKTNVSGGILFLSPVENKVGYRFNINDSVLVDFSFYYQKKSAYLNDACGFIYEYTLDSVNYEQQTFSRTYTIVNVDTTFFDQNQDSITGIDTTFSDTIITFNEIVDSVLIIKPKILVEDVENQLEIYLRNTGN